MSRNLVVCCDGTGNVWRLDKGTTNVVKLVECLLPDRARQLYYYDPGVGTPDGFVTENSGFGIRGRLSRLAGLAAGDGVWANVAQAYGFLIEEFRGNDRIFLFGFSRGAFTARAVSGLLHNFGLLQPEHATLVPTLIGIYRSDERRRQQSVESVRDRFCYGVQVHFIGVWDTVESVGLKALALGTGITSNPSVKQSFTHVRHAVALDELRWPYEPRLYAPPGPTPGRSFKQVWFAGAHSDVGGGYARSGLSNAALHWMVREAVTEGLLVDLDKLDSRYGANAFDRLHDETLITPLWTIAGAFKRSYPAQDFRVHESVARRLAEEKLGYRPPLPKGFVVEPTRTRLSDPSGREVERPVPGTNEASAASRTRFGPGFWIALLLLSAASAGLFLFGGNQGVALATVQLTGGWSGDLAGAIAKVGLRESLGPLLTIDFLAIAAYAAAIAYLMRAVLAFSDPDGYPGERLGVWLSLSGGYLPVSDAVENLLTLMAVGFGAVVSSLPFAVSGLIVCSALTSVLALVKFVLLAAFALGCCAGLAIGAFRRRAGPRVATG